MYVLITISRKKVKPRSYAQVWRLLDENGQPHNNKVRSISLFSN
jgi:hypothetical protein